MTAIVTSAQRKARSMNTSSSPFRFFPSSMPERGRLNLRKINDWVCARNPDSRSGLDPIDRFLTFQKAMMRWLFAGQPRAGTVEKGETSHCHLPNSR